MNKYSIFCKFTFIFLAFIAFSSNAEQPTKQKNISQSSNHSEDNLELQNKILWINQITETITKILTYNDKLVLTQEYEKLLDNTNFDNLPDGEIKECISEIFDVLKKLSDTWEDKEYVKKEYKRACDQAFRTAALGAANSIVSGVFGTVSGNIFQVTQGASDALTIATGYFSAKEEAVKNFGDKNRELDKTSHDSIHKLRTKVWNSIHTEIKNSKISDKNRISINDYKELISTIKNGSIKEKFSFLSMQKSKQKFSNLPSFWYYLGRSALATKNFKEAKEAFIKFRNNYRSILRDDEILHDCTIAEISLLMYNMKENKQEIIKKLDYLQNIIPNKEWHKNYFIANCYFMLSEYDKAKKILETNLITLSIMYKENSNHEYVDLFGTKNIPISELPHDDSMKMLRTLLAKIEVKDKSFNFEEFIEKYNHHQTLSIYEKMSYLGAVSNTRIIREIKKNLTSIKCDIKFSTFGSNVNISLPTEWFCSSPMPKFTLELDESKVSIKKIKVENKQKDYITLNFATSFNIVELKKHEEMSLTILHQYCPVKLYFSISEIKDNNDSHPPKGTISYYWTKAKQKLQNKTYKLSPSSFIFNNQKEAL